jgi:hypothetical protein
VPILAAMFGALAAGRTPAGPTTVTSRE